MPKFIKMYKLIVVIVFLMFSTMQSYSQSYKKLMTEGMENFTQERYKSAYKLFSKASRKITVTEQDIQEACYWASYAYFKSHNPIDRTVIDALIIRAANSDNIEVSKFYALIYPFNNEAINQILRYKNYSRENYGESCFYKALICAKSDHESSKTIMYSMLHEALADGFKIPEKHLVNRIMEYNEDEYLKILKKYNIDITSYKLKKFVEAKVNLWQQKGKFEKTFDYKKRVTELAREIKVKEFAKLYLDSVGQSTFNLKSASNEYDADNEVFKIKFDNNKHIYISVPISEAPDFDDNFSKLIYENPQFTVYNNEFDILHVEIKNPSNNKTYVYDASDKIAFNTSTLSLDFTDINITLKEQEVSQKTIEGNSVIKVGKSDVDSNIPIHNKINPNKFALIIGNENYQTYQTGLKVEQNVEFAVQDALSFKEYCISSLGVPAENIIFNSNVGVVQMMQSLNKINTIIKTLDGEGEIIFYYAGHGFPDEETNEPYLIPVDVTSSSLNMAVKLSDVVHKLTEYDSKSVVMFLDACFTGGGRNMGLLASRGITVTPKKTLLQGNIVLFSASSTNQSALPYPEKGHGLFTYFLLKKLQESKGEVTLKDLDTYLNKQVSIKSTMIHAREQNPETSYSKKIQKKWESIKL